MLDSTFCPVCGYDLKLTRLDEVVEHCLSCGFDFKKLHDTKAPYNHFNKDNLFVRVWRDMWLEAHMPWCGKNVPRPTDWDPVIQMDHIGMQLDTSFEAWLEKNPIISSENNEKFLQIALRKLNYLDWKPEVIQALWDGDTQGWYLIISVSTSTKHFRLFYLRGSGGDFRVFNGGVPPWPEAQVGQFVGEALSKSLGIPFYFPSPETPDDDYADWWERDEQRRCSSCGKYLRDDDYIKGICFSCKRRQEKRESE